MKNKLRFFGDSRPLVQPGVN